MKLPRQPFVGLSIAAGAGIILADYLPPSPRAILFSLGAVLLFAFACMRWPNERSTYPFVVCGFFLLHSIHITRTPGLQLVARIGEQPRVLTVTGAVVTEPKIAANGLATFLLKLSAMEINGVREPTAATIFARWRGTAVFGDEITLFGVVSPISPPRNPGEFDMRSYLARRDVYRNIVVRYPEDGHVLRHGGGNPILRAAQTSRNWMQATLCRNLDDAADVQNFLSGIVLGLRHQTPEDIEEPFQQTGTLHLFAVAGLHVGIVARLLWVLATVAQLSRKRAAALIIPLLFFYAAITGLHVSSVRAAVMSSILLGGFFFERKVFALNSLAAAAFFLLCWDTNELFSTGFQLSFAVVGAIVLFADPLSAMFRRWSAPDAFLPMSLLSTPRRAMHSILTGLSRASSVSAAAWIGSLVLVLWYFYLIAPISLLANLVVVPIAFFILALAMLSLVSAPLLPWLSIVFNNANFFLARLVLAIVHFFAQLPSGHIYAEHPRWPDGTRVKIDILDLGAGAAVRLHNAGHEWLFDCGSERDYDRILREYLHAAGVNKLDGLVFSHGDASHIGGATSLVSDLRPSLLIDNPAADRSSVHRRLRSFVRQKKLPLDSRIAGDKIDISREVTAQVLYPPRGFSASTADDEALVVQLYTPSATVLLMSDNGEPTEQLLLASGINLRSDILVKGQNHLSASGSDAFIDAVQPRLIIATSRDFPNSERVSDQWANRIRERGIKLFRQDETGAVQLRFGPNDWEARAYVTGEIFRSSTR